MKLVFDFQGGQGASQKRGIGRYSQAFAEALARRSGSNKFILALNGSFQDTVEPIRQHFNTILPREQIICWQSLNSVKSCDLNNRYRQNAAEILRESFLKGLNPDLIHISSLFEGYADDSVTSIGKFSNKLHTSITFYDLIPMMYPDHYFTSASLKTWYFSKLAYLRSANLFLSISESSRREAIELLKMDATKVINISAAADNQFHPIIIDEITKKTLLHKLNLKRPFVMYTGGADHRKNIDGLICAYAALPKDIRLKYQLAIICPICHENIKKLKLLAQQQGLEKDELVLTGFIQDSDLLLLYNLCRLFCFPSLHEGFGLPALEAMQCGAPTIGSNTSSIPEVIGRSDALFDPWNKYEFTAKLYDVLNNSDFRKKLSEHGLLQAKKFSWDETARRAWDAFEEQHEKKEQVERSSLVPVNHESKARLAYVSPLSPTHSGIADYSAELLLRLKQFYNIDIIVNPATVDDLWINTNCAIHNVEWFNKNAYAFDRIIYHFGNSPFHDHMFDLAKKYPGIVVLHDFYFSGDIGYMSSKEKNETFFSQCLYNSHGYKALYALKETRDLAVISNKYPINLTSIKNSLGVVVHSSHSTKLSGKFYGDNLAQNWSVIPLPKTIPKTLNRKLIRNKLCFSDDSFIVCSFRNMSSQKLNDKLVEAWCSSKLSRENNSYLVFVGNEEDEAYSSIINDLINRENLKSKIRTTGTISLDIYQKYLAIADVAVQALNLSHNETSAVVNDCMAHALPTIVNVHGHLCSLPEDCVDMLPDNFSNADLVAALERLHENPDLRKGLGKRAMLHIQENLSPHFIARQYYDAIENFSTKSRAAILGKAIGQIAKSDFYQELSFEGPRLADALNKNLGCKNAQKQILVDISELIQHDSATGIQRVVRSILKELLNNTPNGYRIEPVYAKKGQSGYYYAREFTLELLNIKEGFLSDTPITFQEDDIFLGLDLQHHIVIDQLRYYAALRRQNVKIFFVVYDLLPITLPHCFPHLSNGVSSLHEQWLQVIADFSDGLLCISKTVSLEVIKWIKKNRSPEKRPVQVRWFHLGSDIKNSHPSKGLPSDASITLTALSQRITFLTVGTIEPRKRHTQILAAFNQLWAEGVDLNLVIVGKQGWLADNLIEELLSHKELGRRLFWLRGISDEYLESIYASSNCLIAASEDEGFGLPLIEAAQHKLPIIVRDISIFREVAQEHAFYFTGMRAEDLKKAIQSWLLLLKKNEYPRTNNLASITWEQSTQQLLKLILKDEKISEVKVNARKDIL